MSEKTIERIESGDGAAEVSYKRVAVALGFPETIFTAENYVPTPDEWLEVRERKQHQLEANNLKVDVARISDVRDVLAFSSAAGHVMDDSQVLLDDVDAVAQLREYLTDWFDILADLSATQRLESAHALLDELRAVEKRGYVIKSSHSKWVNTVSKQPFRMLVIAIFRSQPADARLPDAVWISRKMGLG